MNFASDILTSRSKFLPVRPQQVFDPENFYHLAALKKYLSGGSWDILFEAEWPHVTVPATVLHKLAKHVCKSVPS